MSRSYGWVPVSPQRSTPICIGTAQAIARRLDIDMSELNGYEIDSTWTEWLCGVRDAAADPEVAVQIGDILGALRSVEAIRLVVAY